MYRAIAVMLLLFAAAAAGCSEDSPTAPSALPGSPAVSAAPSESLGSAAGSATASKPLGSAAMPAASEVSHASPSVLASMAFRPGTVLDGEPFDVVVSLSAPLPRDVEIPIALVHSSLQKVEFVDGFVDGQPLRAGIAAGETSGSVHSRVFVDWERLDLAWSRREGAADGEAYVEFQLHRLPDGLGYGEPARSELKVVRPPNRAPEVTVSCDPCAVGRRGDVALTATATDEDGDDLSFRWHARKGRFTAGQDSAAAIWRAPNRRGRVTLRVTVSDGTDTVEGAVTVRVRRGRQR